MNSPVLLAREGGLRGFSPKGAASAASPSSAAITAMALTKTYEVRPVLRGVSFSLDAGKTLALLGANGAGKTTLLRILATLARPTGGTATIAGHDVYAQPNAVRRVVGYVGHQPLLYDDMTVRENLLFYARMYGVREAGSRAEALLRRVGMLARANDRVRVLSRGQVQRLELARAVFHEPAVLLLDEPDTGLDADALALLEGLVRERASHGQTTLLTTHDLARGLSWADEAAVLARGRIAHFGPARDLTAADVRQLFAGQTGQAGREGGGA